MNGRIDAMCVLVLGFLAGSCILAGAQVEANGRQAPSWIVGVATAAVGAISGFLGRSISDQKR